MGVALLPPRSESVHVHAVPVRGDQQVQLQKSPKIFTTMWLFSFTTQKT